jgi:hypothetical protein
VDSPHPVAARDWMAVRMGDGVLVSGVFGLECVDFTNMENLLEWRRFFLRREVI